MKGQEQEKKKNRSTLRDIGTHDRGKRFWFIEDDKETKIMTFLSVDKREVEINWYYDR